MATKVTRDENDDIEAELVREAVNRRREIYNLTGRQTTPGSRIGSNYRKTADVDNLITICTKKLDEEPKHKKALFIRASSYMKKGMYDETIRDCNVLLSIDHNNPAAYYIRGCAFDKLGEIDLEIKDFTTVLKLDPNHVNAAYARASAQNRKGNFAKAIEDYQRALEKDQERPTSPNRKLLMKKNSLGGSTDLGVMKRSSEDFFSGMDASNSDLVTPNDTSDRPFGNKNIQFVPSPRGYFGQNTTTSGHEESDYIDSSKLFGIPLSPKNHDNTNDSIQMYSENKKLNMRGPSMGSDYENKDNSNYQLQFDGYSQMDPSSTMNSYSQSPNMKNFFQTEFSNSKQSKSRADWFHAQGYAARKRGDFVNAIDFYSKALELNGQHFKALFNRGFAYDKIGEYDMAIRDYSRALDIDPKNAYAYYNRGISLDRKGDFDAAIENFTQAIDLEPNKADFYHNRGFAFRKKKAFDKAITDYAKAIMIDGKHFKAFYNRAFCYDKIGNQRAAETDYLDALELQPNNINALHHLGTLREKMGGDRLQLAMDNFNQVVSLDESYAPSFNGRGLVWDRMNQYNEALKDFSKAIELDSANAVYWHNRACCLRNMGWYDRAIEDFNKAVELDPRNPIIYSNRGLVWRKLERYDKAVIDYGNEIKYGNRHLSTNGQYMTTKNK